jgi:outer membrane protein OmpA-like peptidoglycan-associated protein
MKGLEQTLEVLKGRSDIKVKVVGYADENECHISDCQNLSFRRAKFVFDWLLEHGVPSEQLKGPEGLSTTWPLYRNATEKERVFNQRVDFEIYACCQLESVN